MIDTKLEVDCEASQTTTFNWKIYKISEDPVVLRPLATPELISQDGNQATFNLEARSLDFGFYKFHFTVTMEGVVGISGSADAYIHVVATQNSLQAVVGGGPQKRYKFGSNVSSCVATRNVRKLDLLQIAEATNQLNLLSLYCNIEISSDKSGNFDDRQDAVKGQNVQRAFMNSCLNSVAFL